MQGAANETGEADVGPAPNAMNMILDSRAANQKLDDHCDDIASSALQRTRSMLHATTSLGSPRQKLHDALLCSFGMKPEKRASRFIGQLGTLRAWQNVADLCSCEAIEE
jgi:hypothetical protein